MDGDSCVTCKEWVGTDPVFDVLDANGDRKVFPEEIAAGLAWGQPTIFR